MSNQDKRAMFFYGIVLGLFGAALIMMWYSK